MLKISSLQKIWLGRDREVSEIETGFEELARGRGSLFLVTGEPGIGKTRLADEVGRSAAARNILVHWGRAWEAGGAPAYWPFIQALRTISDRAIAIDALATPSETPAERFQLFEVVDDFLRTSTPPPRLIVLDDLHAADPSSVELLHFIARNLHSRPLMLIGTYRDAEARLSVELQPLLTRIAREACVLPLRRLDRNEVATFIAQATGIEPTRERVDQLYSKTEGNPFFLRELLRLHGSESEQPESIRAVARGRVALLPRKAREVLEVAAVLGREFAAAQLAVVAGVSELEARALVEPATHAGIVETLDDPPRWRFTHVLLRQGLYDDLSTDRRAALHSAVATELRGRSGHPPLAEIAHHLLHAIPAVSAIDAGHAALSAAKHALNLLAFEDALGLFRSAETLFERTAGEERASFEATLGVGLALMRMAEVERGREACGRAAELARRLDDGELFARAVLTRGYEHVPAVHDAICIAELEEALARLPPGDGTLRARCMAQLASDRTPEPDMGPLIDLARNAVIMARRVGDTEALRATLSAASFALALYSDPADRVPILLEMLHLALAARDKRVALRAHAFLAGSFLELGDSKRAQPHMLAVHSLVQEFRHGRFNWLFLIGTAFDAMSDGRFEEALRLYNEAERSLEQDEARGAVMAAVPVSVACLTEQYDDRFRLETKTRSAFGSIGDPLSGCIGEMLVAQLHGRAGDRERATTQLATCGAHPLFEAIAEPSWLAMVTDACHLACDAKLANRLFSALLPRADRFVFLGPFTGCVDLPYARHLGLLAETLGRLDDAVAYLEDAVARTTHAKMRVHLSRLKYELARTLLLRDGPGDRERAVDLVGQARALAIDLGQSGLLPRLALLGVDEAEVPPRERATSARIPTFSLSREGEFWSVSWEHTTVRLRDTRGLSILARLVESPGQELHVLQLVSAVTGEARDTGDAGPALDGKAVADYRRRLMDLREELTEAEAFGDTARAERLRAELEFLTRELARAVGLGGRDRRTGDAAERARTAVQKRLREAVRRIGNELPDLGRHLDQAIQTGIFCGYFPHGRQR